MLSLGSCVVTWSSKKQETFAFSSSEVEYAAVTSITRQVLWLRTLLVDFNCEQKGATEIFCDNRSELETLRIKPNEKLSDFEGKLSSIMAKFKGLGKTLEDKVLVRKLLNSVPKKFLPIVATIEQCQDLDEMSFEEAIGRLTAYEERIKSQDTLKANDQDKLHMASSNNKTYGKWRGKDFNKEGKESMKWKNNPNARRASTSQGTKDKSKLRCYECDEHGHFAKECTKWKNKQEESHLIYDTDTESTLL
nr:zinc finger, CCHC-type [Tanacetum cinerariifolium]